MAIGLGEQIEGYLTYLLLTRDGETPWKENRRSNKESKVMKHRRERQRAKMDPECQPCYRRYHGYEW